MKKNIINAFRFLVDDYDCSLSYEKGRGELYIYQNNIIKLKIYVWEQFDELDINLIYNIENYHIDPFIDNTKEMAIINKKRRGIKGLFYNYDKDFWIITAKIVKNKIKEIFG